MEAAYLLGAVLVLHCAVIAWSVRRLTDECRGLHGDLERLRPTKESAPQLRFAQADRRGPVISRTVVR